MSNIAIVGGGIAGLSAAYHLSKEGHMVTVFEADPELGGLAGSFTVGAARLEKFYHHWFTSDHEIISIIDELDLNEYIDEVDSNTAVFVGNSFFKLSNPKDLLKFSPLSFFNRLRLILNIVFLVSRSLSTLQIAFNKYLWRELIMISVSKEGFHRYQISPKDVCQE